MTAEKRIVTPAQLSEGWFLKVGCTIVRRGFRVHHRLPDGNYLVYEPTVESEILSDGSVRHG